MTHRDRRLNVPELNLENLPKKFPLLDNIMQEHAEFIAERLSNIEIHPRPCQDTESKQEAFDSLLS